MKLDTSKIKSLINKDSMLALGASIKEVANRWSDNMLLASKLVGSLVALVGLVSATIVGIEWFLTTYGTGTFVFALIVSTFILSVVTTAAAKSEK